MAYNMCSKNTGWIKQWGERRRRKGMSRAKFFSPRRGATGVLTWNQKTREEKKYCATMATTGPKIKTAFKAATGL